MADTPEQIHRHRRNLMLVSTVFILYVATGATLPDINDVQLRYFFDIKIERPEVVFYFAWLLFAWYWFRFWLSLRGRNEYRNDLVNLMGQQGFLNSLGLRKMKGEEKDGRTLRAEITKLERIKGEYCLKVHTPAALGEDKSWHPFSPVAFRLSPIRYYWLLSRHWLSVAVAKSSSFWDERFPYAYALIALILGVTRAVSPP